MRRKKWGWSKPLPVGFAVFLGSCQSSPTERVPNPVNLTTSALTVAATAGLTPAPGTVSQRSHRLQPRFIETDDGLRHPHGFWDTEWDLPCSFRAGRDQVFRCFPETGAQFAFARFRDPLCTEPLLQVCSPESYSVVRWPPARRPFGSSPAMPDELVYGRLGKPVRGLVRIYESDGKRCRGESWSDGGPCRLHEIGSTIPVASLVTGKLVE